MIENILKKLIDGIFGGLSFLLDKIKGLLYGLFNLDYRKIWYAIVNGVGKIGQFFIFLKNLFVTIAAILGGGSTGIGIAILVVLFIALVAFIIVKAKVRKASRGVIGGKVKGVTKRKAKRLARRAAKRQVKKENKKQQKKEKKSQMLFQERNAAAADALLGEMAMMAEEQSDSRWLSDDERDMLFFPVKFSQLPSDHHVGLPIYASYDEKSNDVIINLKQPEHTLIVGATGSGKTTMIVNPTIQILGHSGAHPSMVCMDPKGELYNGHGDMLRACGYEVVSLDMIRPSQSGKWNPLGEIGAVYREYVRAGSEIFERTDDVFASGLTLFSKETVFGDKWYEYRGVAYPDAKSALAEVHRIREGYFDEIFAALTSVISALFSIDESNGEDDTLRVAAKLTVAIALGVLEDSVNLSGTGGRELTFAAIYNTIERCYSSGDTIRDFFGRRSEGSMAKRQAASFVTMSDEEITVLVTKAHVSLSVFDDDAVKQMTSRSDVSISQLSKRPVAIFIRTPEENLQRRALGSVLLLCIYRTLKHQADLSENLTLPRDVFFILDEFGSCKRIPGFEDMITTGRSRRIFFELVIQSFTQLSSIYSEHISGIIKSNCPTKICLGSNEEETCREFSNYCGTRMAEVNQVTAGGLTAEAGFSRTLEERPLISATELARLNTITDNGNAVVTGIGHFPIKSKMTPSYRCPKYEMGVFAALIMGAFILAGAFLGSAMEVRAASMDYSGKLSIDTLSPVESEEEGEGSAHVRIKKGVYYDEDTNEFVYSVNNGEGTVYSTVLDGMMVNEAVSISCDGNADAAVYLDGMRLEDANLSRLSDIGDYSVEVSSHGYKGILFSFSIVGDVSGRYPVFTVPVGFRITGVKRDGKEIEHTKTTVDMSKEGTYLILYGKKKLSKRFVFDMKTDFSPPRLTLQGVDDDGVARTTVLIEGLGIDDTLIITHEGEEISYPSDGLSETGNYVVIAIDEAGNSSRYEFTIMSYFDVGILGFAGMFAVILIIVIVYLVRERKRFRVR